MKAGVGDGAVNWRLAGPEIAFIVEDCKAAIFFVGPEFIEQPRAIKDQIPSVRHFMTTRGSAPEWQDVDAVARRAERNRPRPPDRCRRGRGPALHLRHHGKPKGAMLSHSNLLSMVRSGIRRGAGLELVGRSGVFAGCDAGLPYRRHRLGRARALFRRQGRGGARFRSDRILDFIQNGQGQQDVHGSRRRCNSWCASRRRRTPISPRLRHIAYGASPIRRRCFRECIDVFKCGFVQMYGMTETHRHHRRAAAGRSHSGLERMRLGRQGAARRGACHPRSRGQTAAPRLIGEIAHAFAANMVGYWVTCRRQPPGPSPGTAGCSPAMRLSRRRTATSHSGPHSGHDYFRRRWNFLIRRRWKTRSAIIPTSPEAAVVGVPVDKWGEAVKAIVVLKPGKSATPRPTSSTSSGPGFAGYKTPKSVDFIAALPTQPVRQDPAARTCARRSGRARERQIQLRPSLAAPQLLFAPM